LRNTHRKVARTIAAVAVIARPVSHPAAEVRSVKTVKR
jgi:hypothetical protein